MKEVADQMKKIVGLLLILSMLFCSTAGAFAEGGGEEVLADWKESFENEDYKTALPLLQEASSGGDIEATAALARCYIYGYGIETD